MQQCNFYLLFASEIRGLRGLVVKALDFGSEGVGSNPVRDWLERLISCLHTTSSEWNKDSRRRKTQNWKTSEEGNGKPPHLTFPSIMVEQQSKKANDVNGIFSWAGGWWSKKGIGMIADLKEKSYQDMKRRATHSCCSLHTHPMSSVFYLDIYSENFEFKKIYYSIVCVTISFGYLYRVLMKTLVYEGLLPELKELILKEMSSGIVVTHQRFV